MNELKEKIKGRQGISLVVLILTIIVVIILATAVILSISNNNPIENAKKARDVHNEATLKEAANLAYLDWYSENAMGKDVEEVEEYVQKALEKQGFSSEEIKKVTVTENGVTIKDTTVASTPVIPNGFEYLTGTVDTGYVIQNTSDGNEFVWVPVEDYSKFKRTTTYDGTITDPGSDYSEPYTEASEEEKNEYNQMMASVKKYGGFYIGRYEASKSSEGKAQSIANKEPWTSINWGDSMTSPGTDGAVGKSRAIYPAASATKEKDAVSTLIFGVQWDAAVSFIEKNYPGISKNSTGKGNYYAGTAKKINTGSNSEYIQNNIYDMCGNVSEWTMEGVEINYIVRGGSYYDSEETSDARISARAGELPMDGGEPKVGFRLALYVK